ncbi:MAG: hypothetical protein AABW86_05755 [Candidatus Micrarchaeota archaeon]
MKILVFGNALVKKDSLALSVAHALEHDAELRGKGIEFVEFDTAENLEDEGPDITILDVASGIKKVTELTDMDRLEKSPSYSMHDFDLAVTLKLLKKIGKIKTVRIIAIPSVYEKKRAVKEVKEALTSKSDFF